MKKYNHQKIEKKWQKLWEKTSAFRAEDGGQKPKYYCLIEFPYPSGDGLHVGHVRSYTAMDIISRKKRLQGFNVLYPIGWDAFGLPTENFAIKSGKHPTIITKDNIEIFKKQIKSLGISFDWNREITTTDPEYYKWTQWIFLQLYKHGLAYKKKMPINWCPKCKIGLANEEVIDGRCERCGAETEKKEVEQWMLKITAYADRLIEDLAGVDFLEKIKTQQINWIGRSEGAEIYFSVVRPEMAGAQMAQPGTQRAQPGIYSGHFPRINSGGSRFDGNGRVYFVNFSIKYRNEVFSDENQSELKALIKIFDQIFKENGYNVSELVVMKEHIHLLIDLPIEAKIAEVIKNIKGASARYFFNEFPDLRATLKNHLWTPGYNFDEIVREEDWQRVMNYIKNNPRRAELSENCRFLNEITNMEIPVFTTRLDTIFSGTFVLLSPEHPMIDTLTIIERKKAVNEYIASAKKKSEQERTALDKEKTAVFTGSYVLNPATNEEIPVWVSDFVLGHYGTGAVFGDAHDLRDFELAKKYDISLKVSIRPTDDNLWLKVKDLRECYPLDGVLVNSSKFDGLDSAEAREQILNWLTEKGLAKRVINYHLRDWVFSRQHYWGEPIPIVFCAHCAAKNENLRRAVKTHLNFRKQEVWGQLIRGEKTVESRALNPEEPDRYFGDLKVGDLIVGANKNTGEEILLKIKSARIYKSFVEFFADKDAQKKIAGKVFDSVAALEKGYDSLSLEYAEKIKRNGLIAWEVEIVSEMVPLEEKDLPLELPMVKNYQPTDTGESPLASMEKWVNVKCPKCGGAAWRETDTMPNWAGSSWYFLRYVDPANSKKLADFDKLKHWLPVDLYNGGMEHTTLHLLYSRFWHKFLYDIGAVPTREPYQRRVSHGMILAPDGQKMSKSRGNVINPDLVVQDYGADALRLYEMFIGPYDQTAAWDVNGLTGIIRFLEKIYSFANFIDHESSEVTAILHKTIKKITDDIDKMRFNTAVSAMMIFANKIQDAGCEKETFKKFLILLNPFAPHITEELWSDLVRQGSVSEQIWPGFDENLIAVEKIEIAVQVNGKVRDKLLVNSDITEEELKTMALGSDNVQKFLSGKEPKKIIYVKGKLLSLVV